MVGPGLIGGDLDGEGVEVVAILPVWLVGQEGIHRVGCVRRKPGELCAGITFRKQYKVKSVGGRPVGAQGLKRGLRQRTGRTTGHKRDQEAESEPPNRQPAGKTVMP